MAKKSPIVLVCERPDKPNVWAEVTKSWSARKRHKLTRGACRWRLRRPIKVAKFRDRRRSDIFAIVHPSTKQPGRCQVSLFDRDGPYGDRIRDTCQEAMNTLEHYSWKLVSWK